MASQRWACTATVGGYALAVVMGLVLGAVPWYDWVMAHIWLVVLAVLVIVGLVLWERSRR